MKDKAPPQSAGAQMLYRSAVEALSSGRFDDGISLLEQLLPLVPPTSEIHNNLGTAHWKSGRLKQAEEQYAKAVRLSPKNALALNNYGALLMGQSRLEEAEKLLKQAYSLKPDHPSVANNMGLIQCWRGDLAAAERSFIAALALRPGWSDAQGNLGNVYRDTNRHDLAEAAYQRAIRMDPKNAPALCDLGILLFSQGRNADAKEALEKSLSLNPASEKAWSQLLQLLEMTNQLEQAREVADKARERFPASPSIAATEAKLLRRDGKNAEALAVMEPLESLVKENSPQGVSFFFELGQLYDRADRADDAFRCFARANACQALTPEARAIDKKAYTTIAARLKKDYTQALAAPGPAAPPEVASSPVFLVGSPRSGTTLLDQILSSHPGVYVGEEKPAVGAMGEYMRKKYGATARTLLRPQVGIEIWGDAHYPSAISQLQAGDIAEMRQIFFSEHGPAADGRLLVDKLPINIMHAGLIHAVFPKSKFILALRHPCDCVLSCFMQAFAMNAAMVRFLDIEDGARFYDEMFSVWEHTAKTAALDSHAIRYEDVVSDFRPTVKALLDFLGLEWTNAVLEYDKTARSKERINTPSYQQVTEKIYTRASGRWLRYQKHMKHVLDILAPHADRYGYSVKIEE
ncbi:MAG: sulfotransferase [Alphaproteobacteria bacterium]